MTVSIGRTSIIRYVAIASAVLSACGEPTLEEAARDRQGPGDELWGAEDISCDVDNDCLVGEACLDGICQPERCTGADYVSRSPIGDHLVFFQENEVAVADGISYQGDFWVDGYGPGSGNLNYDHSWPVSGAEITDLAGGNFTGKRPEVYAASIKASSDVAVLLPTGTEFVDLGFIPVAIAAGDSDSDGYDELVAIDRDGQAAICSFVSGECLISSFDDAAIEQLDVAVGDVDGDVHEEVAILLEYDGEPYIYVLNSDWEKTGQVDNYQAWVGEEDPQRIAIADTDGDLVAEIFGLTDGGVWGWFDDGIVQYGAYEDAKGGQLAMLTAYEADGHGELIDIAATDTDADDFATVLLLSEEGRLVALDAAEESFATRFDVPFNTTSSPQRIATADHDGNSPRAEIVDGPIDCQGNIVPIMVMTLPPYDSTFSASPGYAFYGDSTWEGSSTTDTVSLSLGVSIGFGATFFDLFGGDVGAKLGSTVSRSEGYATSKSIGGRYTLVADPQMYGNQYGGVVLSWGCFHGYEYVVDDPDNILGGGNGATFVLTVPVDGATSLWSTTRYNALADALGTLPRIDIPFIIGDPDSYPTRPTRIDGTPMDESDLVFDIGNAIRAPDIGEASWYFNSSDSSFVSESRSIDLGASADVKVAGVSVGVEVGMGFDTTYSVDIGSSALFGGGIPAIPDDPATPEDEYALHAYTVTPLVYMHPYEDAQGNEAKVYVQTYMVGR